MNRRRLLRRLGQGHLRNVRFADLIDLVEGFGFQLDRVRGSHHIFHHPIIQRSVNLQEEGGEATPCQIRQFLALVGRYNLDLED